jgi:beta-lactamase regulating signal transducer with metallopeptidase domain
MLLTWMAYATLIGALIGAAALALDALALRHGIATRFIWLTALIVVVVAPALFGLRTPKYEPPQKRAVATATTAAATVAPHSVPAAAPRAPRLRVRILVLLLKADVYSSRVWLAASLAYLAILLRAAIAIRRRHRQWRNIDVDGTHVLVSPDTGPAVVGAIRPRIVLPHWALSMDPSARALMLRHELEHIEARDPIALAAAVLLNALFPWNAAVWAIARRLRLAIEIDCDRRVVGAFAGAREYGELLLAVGSRGRTPFFFVASLVERHGFLEQRIKAMTPSPTRYPRIAAAALALLAVVVTTAAVRAPRPGPFLHRTVSVGDSLTVAELRALLAAHQPEALIAASGINTVTVLLDANGNYVTSLAETRAVTSGGGRGGRGGAQRYVVAGELSTRDAGMVLSDGRNDAPGGRARGNVRDGFPADSFPTPPARITKSQERRQVDPVSGDTVKSVRVSSLSVLNGDTVILSFRESSGETGFVKHVYITLDGPIGAGEIFGFNENVLGNLVAIQQVQAVHAHAYIAGEVGEQRLNVFVVRLKP